MSSVPPSRHVMSRHVPHSWCGSLRGPTVSFTVALTWVPTHVSGKLVARSVVDLHLVTYPFGVVPLEFLVPETAVVLNGGVGFAMVEFLAVWAWVGWMAGMTAVAEVIVSLVGVLVSVGATAVAAVLSRCFGRGATVVMDGGRVFGVVGVGLDGLLLEELSEE